MGGRGSVKKPVLTEHFYIVQWHISQIEVLTVFLAIEHSNSLRPAFKIASCTCLGKILRGRGKKQTNRSTISERTFTINSRLWVLGGGGGARAREFVRLTHQILQFILLGEGRK